MENLTSLFVTSLLLLTAAVLFFCYPHNRVSTIHWKQLNQDDIVRMDFDGTFYLEKTTQEITWLEAEEQEAIDYLYKMVSKSNSVV